MSNLFKTQILNDLANVFLNPNEFAEPHNINGVDGVICVIDTDTTQALRPGLGRFEGMEKESIMLLITEVNWPGGVVNGVITPGKSPVYNQTVTVDSVRYRIKRSDLFNGLYELPLEAIK